MTYEETIDLVTSEFKNACIELCGGKRGTFFECDLCNYAEAHDESVEALKRASKYKWHDLRKDPEDLPKGYTMAIIARKSNNVISFEFCEYEFFEGYGYLFAFVPQNEVVAWKEIEPFNEENE